MHSHTDATAARMATILLFGGKYRQYVMCLRRANWESFFLHSTVVTFVFSEYSCFMSVFYSRELILWMPRLPTSFRFYPILSVLSPSSHSYYSNSMPHSLATANFDEKIYCAYHIHRRCCHSFCSARQTHKFFWRFPDPTLFLTHTNMRSHF